jgi:cell division protein FtsI (penicillin-binding protein 3)
MRLVFMAVAIVTGLIVIQLINLQLLQGSQWKQRARELGLQYRIKKATRGNIYDANKVMLATSIPLYKLSLDPMAANEDVYGKGIDSLSRLLADFFKDQSALDYLKLITNARLAKKHYLILNVKLLNYLDKKMMLQWPIFREGQYKGGVLFEKAEERTYPFGDLAKRTVGFMNENNEGAGLELTFQKELAGVDGKALYQKISGGDWMPVRSGSRIQPLDGVDLYTTLDINMQEIAKIALEKAVKRFDANFGCVVIMDVKTGEVKAISNLGRVKPGEFAENYNYALGDAGSSDPGSTFKTASMVALLEDTTLTLTDTIQTGGGTFRYYDRVMTDTRSGGWGTITVQEAFEQSSNIGISRLITRHFGKIRRNPDLYIDYLHKFNLGTPLQNFKFAGLTKPYIKNSKDPSWSGVSLPWMSVGYETRVSPLQLLAFYNAIANRGIWIEPILVKRIMKNDKIIEDFTQKVRKQRICSEATIQKIQVMLEGVVERGTAKDIKTDKYKIAGKTGTSQKLSSSGRIYTKKHKTSFAGYFPADNPKYSMIVVIDEPKGGEQYGGDVSAPVFREIADKLFALDVDVQSKRMLKREVTLFNTDLPKNQTGHIQDFKTVLQTLKIHCNNTYQSDWVSPVAGKYMVDWQTKEFSANKVPNLKGMSLRDVIYILENRGLKVFYDGKGRVKTQSMMPGTPLKRGDKIVIRLE